jgi:hypothetical protein
VIGRSADLPIRASTGRPEKGWNGARPGVVHDEGNDLDDISGTSNSTSTPAQDRGLPPAPRTAHRKRAIALSKSLPGIETLWSQRSREH